MPARPTPGPCRPDGKPHRGSYTPTWSVVVHYDGQPVTGPVPCTDWDAAGLVAAFFTGWGGGRVSVGSAVMGAILGQLDLLEEPPP